MQERRLAQPHTVDRTHFDRILDATASDAPRHEAHIFALDIRIAAKRAAIPFDLLCHGFLYKALRAPGRPQGLRHGKPTGRGEGPDIATLIARKFLQRFGAGNGLQPGELLAKLRGDHGLGQVRAQLRADLCRRGRRCGGGRRRRDRDRHGAGVACNGAE